MRGIRKRAMALPAAAAGALALVMAGGGAAHAATFSSGTVSLTVSDAWVAQLAKAGVALVPQNYSTLTFDNTAKTVTITFAATGGDANLGNGAGSLSLSGGILGFSLHGKTVSLGSLLFDLSNAQFDGATSTSGEVPLVDLAGSVDGTITPAADGTTQFIESSNLDLDAAGAALLDSALGTHAFTAGQNIGAFSSTWTD